MKRVVSGYRIELLALLIGLLGVFLIVEKIELRKTLAMILHSAVSVLNAFLDKFLAYFVAFTLSDLLGWLLIFLVVAFVIWRIRYRFSRSAHFYADMCPKCKGEMHRVHRSNFDRFLALIFLPDARRYCCSDKDCGWSGLRRRRASEHQHHHRPATEVN